MKMKEQIKQIFVILSLVILTFYVIFENLLAEGQVIPVVEVKSPNKGTIKFYDEPQYPYSDRIGISGDLSYTCFDFRMANDDCQGTLYRCTFESMTSAFHQTEFKHVKIKDCIFAQTPLNGARFGPRVEFIDCDFTNARINCSIQSPADLPRKDLFNPYWPSHFCAPKLTSFSTVPASNIRQTKSFKEKNLSGVVIQTWQSDDFILDYSAFKLHNSQLPELPPECKFEDAEIRGAKLSGMTKTQLYSTNDYKKGILQNITFDNSDFSNIDFASINLTDCKFIPINLQSKNSNTNLKDADFNGSIISDCDFTNTKNLTIGQIKSTWNYKNNRMEGIKLPAEIQEALDAEKQKLE
jgi:uncharacterized protein YjbI with pentapeptide repeats